MTDRKHPHAPTLTRGLITLTTPLRLPTGVLLLAEPWREPEVNEEQPQARAAPGPQVRPPADQHAALAADLERLHSGWTPDEACLDEAPVLSAWRIVQHEGEALPSLLGLSTDHPCLGPGRRRVLTSNIVAFDGAGELWARTLSRFYRLGHPGGETLS